MSKQHAPLKLKEGDEVTQAGVSNELKSELDGTSENVEKSGLSLPWKRTSSRDESYTGKETSGVSSKEGSWRTTAEQSLDREEESHSHATKQPSVPHIDKPTESDNKIVAVSENGTTSSSASTASLLGPALNFAPLSVGMIPPQAGSLSMASQFVSLPHLLQAQAPRTPLNIAPLLNQLRSVPPLSLSTGSPHIMLPQAHAPSPPSSLQSPLIGQSLQLAPLAQNNVAEGLPHVPQGPSASSLQASMSRQLADAQSNQNSYSPPIQSASYPTNSNQLQSACDPQNPSFLPITRQFESQLVQSLIQDNMIKDQLIAFLLSQQQTGVPNNSSTSAQMAAPANHLEFLLRNSIAGPASNSELALQGASSVAVSAYPLQQQSTQNMSSSATSGAISDIDSERSNEATYVAAPGHLHAPQQSKDKRWMIRYQELNQFQQVKYHAMPEPNFPHFCLPF